MARAPVWSVRGVHCGLVPVAWVPRHTPPPAVPISKVPGVRGSGEMAVTRPTTGPPWPGKAPGPRDCHDRLGGGGGVGPARATRPPRLTTKSWPVEASSAKDAPYPASDDAVHSVVPSDRIAKTPYWF